VERVIMGSLRSLRKQDRQPSIGPPDPPVVLSHVDTLPDESFIILEKGYIPGISPKSWRHLPYRDGEGRISESHLKAAILRYDKIRNVSGSETDKQLQDRARHALQVIVDNLARAIGFKTRVPSA
jgi:hypothetical protein